MNQLSFFFTTKDIAYLESEIKKEDLEDKANIFYYANDLVSDVLASNPHLFPNDESVSVDFLRKKGRPIHGSTRIPLLVRQNSQSFIIKEYDAYDNDLEKVIISEMAGGLVPQVIAFGNTGYAEEFLDPEEYINLEEFAQKREKDKAYQIAGKIHGLLAGRGVGYFHSHYTDEFHIGKQNVNNLKVVDMGSAQVLDGFRYKHRQLHNYQKFHNTSFNYWINGHSGIQSLQSTSRSYRDSVNIIRTIYETYTTEKFLDYISILSTAMTDFYHLVVLTEGSGNENYWDTTMKRYPLFLNGFLEGLSEEYVA